MWYCHSLNFINDGWFIYTFKQIIKTSSICVKNFAPQAAIVYCLLDIPTVLQQILFYIIFRKKTQSKTTQTKSHEYGYTLYAVVFNKADLIAE